MANDVGNFLPWGLGGFMLQHKSARIWTVPLMGFWLHFQRLAMMAKSNSICFIGSSHVQGRPVSFMRTEGKNPKFEGVARFLKALQSTSKI